MSKQEAAKKLMDIFGNANFIRVLHSILVESSKYIIILLFAIYTWHCFTVFVGRDKDRKEKVYRKQKRIMYTIHFICSLVLFLNSLDIKVLIYYAIQLAFLMFVGIAYPYVYKEMSKVVLNNTVPDGYNSDLVRSEFSNYLPDGYSFSYDDNEYVYKIVNDDGVIVTTPVILTYRGYHRITLNFDSWYGMVTADKSSALVDDTITLTVNPDEHYQVKSVTVNGGVVAVTSNNDGTYSFTMPDGDVTVSAEFELQKHTVNITGEHCTIIIKEN